MRERLLATVFALLAAESTAVTAATLSVSPDKPTYNVGETITLSVDDDAEGASTCCIYGRLEYKGSWVNNGAATQKLMGPAGDWVEGSLEFADSDTARPATRLRGFRPGHCELCGDSDRNEFRRYGSLRRAHTALTDPIEARAGAPESGNIRL